MLAEITTTPPHQILTIVLQAVGTLLAIVAIMVPIYRSIMSELKAQILALDTKVQANTAKLVELEQRFVACQNFGNTGRGELRCRIDELNSEKKEIFRALNEIQQCISRIEQKLEDSGK